MRPASSSMRSPCSAWRLPRAGAPAGRSSSAAAAPRARSAPMPAPVQTLPQAAVAPHGPRPSKATPRRRPTSRNGASNLPERLVTLNLSAPPGGTAPLPIVLQIGVPTPRDDRAYARIVNALSVYAVSPRHPGRDVDGALGLARPAAALPPPPGRRSPACGSSTSFPPTPGQSAVLEWKADGGIVAAGTPNPAPGADAAVHELLQELGSLRASPLRPGWDSPTR